MFQLLECIYVRQALDLLEGLIPESEDNKDISSNHLKLLIVFAVMWSLGALLELSDRRKVRAYLHRRTSFSVTVMHISTVFVNNRHIIDIRVNEFV